MTGPSRRERIAELETGERMITVILVIILGCVLAWALTSRELFRYWVRNDTFIILDNECSHGYTKIHRSCPCHSRHPSPHGQVAALAIGAGLFFPATAFTAFVVARPPLGRRELAERTRALEAENARLQREQEKRK